MGAEYKISIKVIEVRYIFTIVGTYYIYQRILLFKPINLRVANSLRTYESSFIYLTKYQKYLAGVSNCMPPSPICSQHITAGAGLMTPCS